MKIFDAHLDLAMNALAGRDITKPAVEQPAVGTEIATVGLPDLRAGGVTNVCATIFCQPHTSKTPGYRTPDEAFAMAMKQIDYYRTLDSAGELKLSTHVAPPSPEAKSVVAKSAETHPAGDRAVEALLLLEGADAIRTIDDAKVFYDAGVRIVGLAWQASRYAGGTAHPGPLTDAGRALVRELDRLGIVHDASHLAEESFWELMDLASGPIIASHSNCREIVTVDPFARHLSDKMISAIIASGGVIGINMYDRFLLPHDQYGTRRATLADVVAHIHHVSDIAGDTRHVGLGTDMDGGLGREQIPVEMTSSADLPLVGQALIEVGFTDADVRAMLFDNWANFFAKALG